MNFFYKFSRLKRNIFIYLRPLLWMVVFILCSLILSNYYLKVGFSFIEPLIDIQIFLTLVATFLGILIPVWIARGYQFYDHRRLMVFAISACWNESRSNLHTLKTIDDNYDFSSSFSLFESDPINNLDKVLFKYETLVELKNLLSKVAYESMLSSNTITYLENDCIYNDLNTGYETLDSFISEFTIIYLGLKLRLKSFQYLQGMPVTDEQMSMLISDVKEKIKKVKKELVFALEKTNKMKTSIEQEVKRIGPILEEIPRDIDSTT